MSGSVGLNPLVVFNWDPATQLVDYSAAVANVEAQVPGAQARIVAIGDSTTAGYGGAAEDYRDTASYPLFLAEALQADGVPAQSDDFVGGGPFIDGRITLTGDATWFYVTAAGGPLIQTQDAGSGFGFTLTQPAVYDTISVNYVDYGGGTFDVSLDGGAPISTIQVGNTGQIVTATISVPAATYSSLQVSSDSSTPTYVEGVAFTSSTDPAVQVYNAGVGGAFSDVVGTGATTGTGEIPGTYELSPNLVLIDYGINDINQELITPAQIAQNVAEMVQVFRSEGADSIIVIPTPFDVPQYAVEIEELRTDLEQVATALNVPIIDLSATYDDNYAALQSEGLYADAYHPDAAFYSIIGSSIAGLLAAGTAPDVTLDPAPVVSSGGTAELGTVSASNGDPVTVQLTSDAAMPAGSTISLQDQLLIYSPGMFSRSQAGTDTISYTVTDTVTGVTNDETQSVSFIACFCRGTRIAVGRGDVPVEALSIGDSVMTLAGRCRTIRWIGKRSYAGRFLAANPGMHPVRLRAGSLGDGLPRRDLLVSPDHAMLLDGLLVPARCLLNGGTITQERALGRVDYFHVELDTHDVILAEGSPTETFVDDDSRSIFHNASEFSALYPGARPSRDYYARRVEQGADLQAIRVRLSAASVERVAAGVAA